MDKNGQLNFSDDSSVPGLNDAYGHLANGDFEPALKIFDSLLDTNQDIPGVEEGYRTTRFWLNRTDEAATLVEGKKTADFYLSEWQNFLEYAGTYRLKESNAFKSVEKYIYYTAAEHYKIAFQNEENPTDNIDLILNLAICFIKTGDFGLTVDTLEYARSTFTGDPRLLSLLGEAYYHLREIPKALLLFRESFFIDPSAIDLNFINADPIVRLKRISEEEKGGWGELCEWIPVFGHITDIFYVKRHLAMHTVEAISNDIYTLEKNIQSMSQDRVRSTNILPRLINRYLWLFDYFKEQNYNFENLTDIRSRLIELDKRIFTAYFKKIKL